MRMDRRAWLWTLVAWGPMLLIALACGGSGGGGGRGDGDAGLDDAENSGSDNSGVNNANNPDPLNNEQPDAGSTNDLFTFEPGPPGAATGLRARVEVEGATWESPAREVLLTSDGQTQRLGGVEVPAGLGGGVGFRMPWFSGKAQMEAHVAQELRRLGVGPAFGGGPRGALLQEAVVVDLDGDGVPDLLDGMAEVCTGGATEGCLDNCRWTENADQADEDGDGVGDVCALNLDNDGINNDGDGSGAGDDNPCRGGAREACDDNCPGVPNSAQADEDGDGVGDVCDEDRDGDGTPDVAQPEADFDGDGVATSEELDGDGAPVDTDHDGTPDHQDPDDDGDGTPSAEEGDPGQDTDEDGTPDREDRDSDGDGVPDPNEGGRDTDGDGTPDRLDTDDDGDGRDTADEIAEGFRDSDGDGVPDSLDDNDEDGCEGPPIGQAVEEIGTFSRSSCWTDLTIGLENGGSTESYTWAVHFAPEGRYASLQQSRGVSLPPNFLGFGIGFNYGCVFSNTPPTISKEFFGGHASYGVSFSFPVGPVALQFTLGAQVTGGRYNGFSMGIGYAVNIASPIVGLLLPSVLEPVGISYSSGDFLAGWIPLGGWGQRCMVPPGGGSASGQGELPSPLGEIAAGLRAQRDGDPSAIGAQSGAQLAPFFEMLGSPTGYGPADGIPAASNADFYADALLGPECEDDCPSTSLRWLGTQGVAGFQGTEDGNEQLAIGEALGYGILEALPQPLSQFNAQRRLQAGVDLEFEVAYRNAAQLRGDGHRYVADAPVEVPAPLNQPVPIRYTAQEVADLLRTTPDRVQGATLCVYQATRGEPTCGVFAGELLEGTVTLERPDPVTYLASVDLSTAPAYDGIARGWVVQPAPRVFVPQPGLPATVAFHAPLRVRSGSPVTLEALLMDEGGQPVPSEGEAVFLDAASEEIGRAPLVGGVASFQYIPTPTTPTLTQAFETDLFLGEEMFRGYQLDGTGFSQRAVITIDGRPLSMEDPEGWPFIYEIAGPELIFVAPYRVDPLPSGPHTFRVENPGGLVAEGVLMVP